MRLGDEDPSSHFEDRTGQSGRSFGGGGLGGGALGLVFQLVASKFGIVGIIVLALGYCALTSLGGGGILGGGGETSSASAPAGKSTLDPATKDMVTRVLGSTERRWADLFAAAGQKYQPTKLIFYRGGTQSGCGAAQSAMGPFYCPSDQSIYLDTDFFNELSKRFGAPGDFAMAYVVAHEVGHHVQNLEGTLDRSQAAQSRASKAQGNAIQVGVELQADCYAGVWAANDKNLMEPGDLEEGVRAAEAIGDDTLQKQMQGSVVPESFTHGSAAQRQAALQRGLTTGNPSSCNYAR